MNLLKDGEKELEVDGGVSQHHKSTHRRHTDHQSALRLQFRDTVAVPVFTENKVEADGSEISNEFPISVVLQNGDTGHVVTTGPEASAELDVVVLEGHFTAESWTRDEFEKHVVRERQLKRPLLTGQLRATLKDGVATLGKLAFTDNSSWVRSRKFRLGVRIASRALEGVRIREAKTEAFTVKDRRGEVYKKHYPPVLHDEVWRLEKIARDGAFHKRLNQSCVYTVEDFICLGVTDPQRLRTILGSGMSDKTWEGALEHAMTCLLSGKLRVFYADKKRNIGAIFNSNYQPIGLTADGCYMSVDTLFDSERVYVDELVKVAYEDWESTVEYDGEALRCVRNQEKGFDSHTEDPLGGRNFYSQGENCGDEPHILKPRAHDAEQGNLAPFGNEQERHVLTYPPGEVGAVSVTDIDMQSLQPERWLRGNIIDFYIKYLERNRLSLENRDLVYFFNSFFFTKLVQSSTQEKLEFEQVRDWTKGVDLFEKKYIFIPVCLSSHWSLIVICNLSGPYEPWNPPYILHLDSMKGPNVVNFDSCTRSSQVDSYIRLYLLEAWKEKCENRRNDRFPSALLSLGIVDYFSRRLRSMSFIQAEVSQQDNGYDCGIYLLGYIECFLQLVSNLGSSATINQTYFEPERTDMRNRWKEYSFSGKRKEIESIIISLSQGDEDPMEDGAEFVQQKDIESALYQGAAAKSSRDRKVVDHTAQNGEELPDDTRPKGAKRKRDSDWTDEETSVLVRCKKEAAVDPGSWFWKEKPGVANWDAIAEEISSSLGTVCSIPKTADQCRLRWDTMTKSYRIIKEHCTRFSMKFSELTRKERVALRLPTTLSKAEWYDVIDQFCPPKSRKSMSTPHGKLNGNVTAPNVDALPRGLRPHSTSQIGSFEVQPGSSSMKEDVPPRTLAGVSIPCSATFENMEYPSSLQSQAFDEGAMQDLPRFSTMRSDSKPVASDQPAQVEIGSPEPQESPGKGVGQAVMRGWSPVNESDVDPKGFGSPAVQESPVSRPSLKSSRKQFAIPGFHSISQNLKRTILNLIQYWPIFQSNAELEDVCRWLAIVQDQSPSETRSYVAKLLELNLLTISSEGLEGACRLNLDRLRTYKKFVKVVISKNLNYDIHDRVLQDNSMLSFESSSVLQRSIRVLTLYRCANLKRADLGGLLVLRSLSIQGCENLKELLGWENLSNLGWLIISKCHELNPKTLRVQFLPSLKEFSFSNRTTKCQDDSTGFKLDFRPCVRLRKVEIASNDRLITSVDLSSLKCLEDLSISLCPALESVVGLSELYSLTAVEFQACPLLDVPHLGHLIALTKLRLDSKTITGFEDVHSLTRLTLKNCSALTRLPDLGALKALTYLRLVESEVEEIRGLDKLHSLTDLLIIDCKALKSLPYLGLLKELARLCIYGSGVREIPGVRRLVNLQSLDCRRSQLELLPDLSHLPRLERVRLRDTPLVTMESSTEYFGRQTVLFNQDVQWTDVIDPDYFPSDQEVYEELSDEHSDSFEASDG